MAAKEGIVYDGKPVTAFLPDTIEDLAIVDLKTLKRIINVLGETDIDKIKSKIIDNVKYSKDLPSLVEFLKTEVNFHETCNLITLYKPKEVEITEPIKKYSNEKQ